MFRVTYACACAAVTTTACWLFAVPMSDPRSSMGAWAASRLVCPDDAQLAHEGTLVSCATATGVRQGPALDLVHFDSCSDNLFGGERLCFEQGVVVARGPYHWQDGKASESFDCSRRTRHSGDGFVHCP
jgi:hypothetical protein